MTGIALPGTKIVVLLFFISLTAVTLVIFSHSDILHLRPKIKSVLCTPKTELNEQATPCQNEVEGFVKVQAHGGWGEVRLVRSHPPQFPEVHLFC